MHKNMSGLHTRSQYRDTELALKKLPMCQSRGEAVAQSWVWTDLLCSNSKRWISPWWALCCHSLKASGLAACLGVCV